MTVLGLFALAGFVNWVFFRSKIANCISVAEMMTGLPQNDTRIIKYISTYHLVPPSTLAYNFRKKGNSSSSFMNSGSSDGALNYSVQKILGFKKRGFFVECSAYDGETNSKTLALEQQYEWTGLLIEPDPFVFPRLVFKHRKAWTSDACLSPDPFPQRLEFLHRIDAGSSIPGHTSLQRALSPLSNITASDVNDDSSKERWRKVQVPCFPIYSILSALKVFHVDYLSCDVQGLELQVLKTIPWNLVRIDVISVSYHLVPEGPESLKSFLESIGYWLVSDFPSAYLFANQSVFPANANKSPLRS
ncbi:Protein Star [Orchesella cincta]|uniref:Protein Star n=1 Tax=Orchesella cincta TaxID=48709 RepID=A0A1D2N9K8_ORCCI|nr:Protein Star [Orchesella cincta]